MTIRILSLIAVLALPTLSFGQNLVNIVKLDTYHENESYEWSGNPITIQFWGYGKVLQSKQIKISEADCRPIDGHYTMVVESDVSIGLVEKITLIASGEDAIFLDAISYDLYETYGKVYMEHKEWGKDNGRGWCLSTDPNDVNGSWSDTVSSCLRSVDFNIASGEWNSTSKPNQPNQNAQKASTKKKKSGFKENAKQTLKEAQKFIKNAKKKN